jgi:mono/diheme cytochrome c family protein
MRSTGWVVGAVLLAVAGACAPGDREEQVVEPPAADDGPPPGDLPPGATAEQATEGRRLYRVACVMCHGEEAEGTPLGPPLASGEWQHGTGTFEDIVAVVTEGAGATDDYGVPMPPRGGGIMTDDEIRAVSAYTYSLSRRRAAPAAETEAEGEAAGR